MSQHLLLDFDDNDKFSKYYFESDYVKAFSSETDNPNEFGIEVFEFKRILKTKRVPNKKKEIEFCVEVDMIIKEKEWGCFSDVIKEKTEEKAIELFLGMKEEMEFFKSQNEKGKFFDGRRYFWNITEKGEPINPNWC